MGQEPSVWGVGLNDKGKVRFIFQNQRGIFRLVNRSFLESPIRCPKKLEAQIPDERWNFELGFPIQNQTLCLKTD